MKNFDIWSEGYRVSGGSGTAHFFGSSSGETFKNACIKFANENPDFLKYFNEEYLSYWGCKLFDNNTDASKSFG